MDEDEVRATLHRYLRDAREALLWKTEGLSERALRTPRTGTGTNLLGLVKHAASVEIGYFGETFGRDWPTPEETPWIARLTPTSTPRPTRPPTACATCTAGSPSSRTRPSSRCRSGHPAACRGGATAGTSRSTG